MIATLVLFVILAIILFGVPYAGHLLAGALR